MSGWTIISGGQTGVDRAALDAARALGLPYGGYLPRGRWTEDGALPDDYDRMVETDSGPAGRTKRNVRESDTTLIITRGDCEGGTLLTLETARKALKPHLVVDLAGTTPETAARTACEWLGGMKPGTLNVAGPRESKHPGIYAEARRLLLDVLSGLLGRP